MGVRMYKISLFEINFLSLNVNVRFFNQLSINHQSIYYKYWLLNEGIFRLIL